MMPNRFNSYTFIIPCLTTLLLSQPVLAKKMYRWVDQNGKTYLSDQVPPDQVQYRRESLSNKGRVIEVTEKAKTREQQELDARLEQLKKAQEKLIAKQKSDDKVLLSTYRSVADMHAVLNKKMLAMGSEHKMMANNLNQSQSQLDRLLNRAATHERNGEKTPAKLLDEIKSAKSQIRSIKDGIGKQLEKQDKVKAEFERDIDRYKFLTQINTEEAKRLSDKSSEMLAADALGLYQCGDGPDCEKAWDVARQFVKSNSTTGIDIDNDRLIMTREPGADSDLSLSISKMTTGHSGNQLFLDIRCRHSSIGAELCGGEKVKAIRTSFRSYIEAGLKSAAAGN